MPDSLLNSWGARVLVGSAVVVVAGMLTLADSLLEPGPHTAAALLLDSRSAYSMFCRSCS